MILKVNNLTKGFRHSDGFIPVLNDISFEIEKGSFVTITGPSGSGKSTLLHILGGLMRPTSGEIIFRENKLHDFSDGHLAKYRRENVGFVMQSFTLIPYLSAEKNIIVALNLQKTGKKQQKENAAKLLDDVGLGNRINHFPRELSYGQQQRVAIARALANNPSIIFADEPTGNLDPGISAEILNLLKRLNEEKQITIVMVTHSPLAAEYGKMRLHLNEGKIN